MAAYADYLYSFAMFRVGDKHVAEDLVQETFVSALKARDGFTGNSTEKTWLTAILKNKIIDYFRKRDVLKGASSIASDTDDNTGDNFFRSTDGHWHKATSPGQWATSADDDLQQVEFQRVLQSCVHKMPPKLAVVFIARYMDDFESEEICKVNNISPSNYWVIIHRAKVLLRACLEKNWFVK